MTVAPSTLRGTVIDSSSIRARLRVSVTSAVPLFSLTLFVDALIVTVVSSVSVNGRVAEGTLTVLPWTSLPAVPETVMVSS